MLILIQIVFVSSTISFIIYEESKVQFIGEHVNLVGKNGYLAELTTHRITETAIDPNHYLEFIDAFEKSKENVSILKNGGIINNKEIPPLPEKYQYELNSLLLNLMIIEEDAKTVYEMAINGTNILQIHVFQESREFVANENTKISNYLVADLNKNYSQTIEYLMILKIIFTILNVIVYIDTTFFMILIIKRETKRISDFKRMQVFREISSKLAHELRTSLTIIIGTTQVLDELINHTDIGIKERWKRLYEALLGMDDKIDELVDCLKSKDSDSLKKED